MTDISITLINLVYLYRTNQSREEDLASFHCILSSICRNDKSAAFILPAPKCIKTIDSVGEFNNCCICAWSRFKHFKGMAQTLYLLTKFSCYKIQSGMSDPSCVNPIVNSSTCVTDSRNSVILTFELPRLANEDKDRLAKTNSSSEFILL